MGVWLVNSWHVVRNPLYIDSFFTLGAGVKLFLQGHSESTFMLYGLINPYALEGLMKLVPGPEATTLLSLLQVALT